MSAANFSTVLKFHFSTPERGRGASGLHSHAERGNEKLSLGRTRSVRAAFPRGAWEREHFEFYLLFPEGCLLLTTCGYQSVSSSPEASR